MERLSIFGMTCLDCGKGFYIEDTFGFVKCNICNKKRPITMTTVSFLKAIDKRNKKREGIRDSTGE